MHKVRVYVDTSVFGGMQDEEFAAITAEFFRQVRQGFFVVLISPLTTAELENAPDGVRSVLKQLSDDQIEPVMLTAEVRELADDYVQSGVLGPASTDDATHVAAASVAGADLIVSWNFRHFVNYSRIRGFNGVNVRNGYRTITILSPREVVDVEQSQEGI
jgi:predicted nucleic acid-binding protein